MTALWWIQMSSQFWLNIAKPVDAKAELSTADRLNLSEVQRYVGMITYDKDLGIHKKLVNLNAWSPTTTEADREDFWSWADSATSDDFVLTWTDIANWYVDLTNIVDQNKLTIFTIRWLPNYDYTITTNRLTFWPSLNLEIWDEIDVSYYY